MHEPEVRGLVYRLAKAVALMTLEELFGLLRESYNAEPLNHTDLVAFMALHELAWRFGYTIVEADPDDA